MSTFSPWDDSAQDLIGYIKSGDLVKVVLLLQRLDLEELEATDPFTLLTPLLALVSGPPTPARLLALQLFLLKGVTRSVLSALDRAKEFKNDAAVDVMSKWAWGKKDDARPLTNLLTMSEEELTAWVTDQKMGAVEQQKGEGATVSDGSLALSALRQVPGGGGGTSGSGYTLPTPVDKTSPERLPLRNASALLPFKPSPEPRPDFNAGRASLPQRPTPVRPQPTQSRKRSLDSAFAPLPTLPRLAAPSPSAFSSDPKILTVHGIPHELGVNKKDIYELLKTQGVERLDVRDLKMTSVKAARDEKGKRMKNLDGKKIGGTLKVEIEFHSEELCDQAGSGLEGTLWRGVKVEIEWNRRSPQQSTSAKESRSWRLPPASPMPSDDELAAATPALPPRPSPPSRPTSYDTNTPGSSSSRSSSTPRGVVDYSDLWG